MRLNSAKGKNKETNVKKVKENKEEAEKSEKAGDQPGQAQIIKGHPEKIHTKGGLDGNRELREKVNPISPQKRGADQDHEHRRS